MIKANITREYPHHVKKYKNANESIYIMNYAYKNNKGKVRISTKPPQDNKCFSLINDNHLKIGHIVFDNTSFTGSIGTLSQCECVVFPETTDAHSWIFFVELKYSDKIYNNENNLKKAICQLYKTRTYYAQKGIFGKNNTCYLAASLPMQIEPFPNFKLEPDKLLNLKQKHNVVLRLTNKAEIIDDKSIGL